MSPRTVHPDAPQNSDSGRLQSLPCRMPKDNHPPGRISTNRRRRLAVTRACGTIPPPLGVAACRACHAPAAAMFPLGGRRASHAPGHDHSRPIQPTSCRAARRLAPANPRPPRSLLPTPPLIHPTASPSRPNRSHRKPRAKRPPPPQAHSGTASHSAGSAKQPVRTAAPPAACFTLPTLYECSVPTTPTASARRTAPTHPPTISRARRSRRMNHTPPSCGTASVSKVSRILRRGELPARGPKGPHRRKLGPLRGGVRLPPEQQEGHRWRAHCGGNP